jgi:hypothetical protein
VTRTTIEKDRFDELPVSIDRRGAHRAPRVTHPGVAFAWAALITGVIVGVGTLAIFAFNGRIDIVGFLFPASSNSSTAAPTAAPTVDPQATISIFNGTEQNGLGSQAGEALKRAGFTVGTISSSSETTATKTIVFYYQKGYEGAAKGVCQVLGATCTTKFTSAFSESGVPLTVVIGSDYLPSAAN